MLEQVVAPLRRGTDTPSLTALLRHAGPTVAGAGTVGLSLGAVGLPATLVMSGAWSLAFCCSRLRGGLRGPASWAAGIVAEVALLASLDFVKALLSPREHGRAAHLLLLGAPVVLGLGLGLLAVRRQRAATDRDTDESQEPLRSSRAPLALAVTMGGLLVALWVSSHGRGFDAAWAMSGDGRNHVLLMRAVLSKGGITLSELKAYPALANAVAADISAAGGRRGLAPGALMLHDARALSATYVLAGIGLSAMFVAALLESLPRQMASARRLPSGVVAITLICSVTTASSFVLGSALLDGFFSTYAALPVAVAALVLATRCMQTPSPYALWLLAAATIFVLFSWTILAVVPIAATVVALAGLGRRTPRTLAWLTAAAVAVASVLLVAGIFLTQYAKLRAQFLVPGPPPTPLQHWVLYLLTLLVVALAASARSRVILRQRAVLVAVAGLGLVTIYWLREITPDGHTWTYYGAKSLWAISASLLWVAFLPLLPTASVGAARIRWTAVGSFVQPVAASLAVVLVIGLLTKVKDPVHEAAQGWTQPSAGVISEVAALGDKGGPFVLWEWSDPGDDRLGDFAAELTWGSTPAGVALPLPGYPQGFFEWGYEDNFQFHQLCLLARAVPGLTIATRQPSLRNQMRDGCPASGAHVQVDQRAGTT